MDIVFIHPKDMVLKRIWFLSQYVKVKKFPLVYLKLIFEFKKILLSISFMFVVELENSVSYDSKVNIFWITFSTLSGEKVS